MYTQEEMQLIICYLAVLKQKCGTNNKLEGIWAYLPVYTWEIIQNISNSHWKFPRENSATLSADIQRYTLWLEIKNQIKKKKKKKTLSKTIVQLLELHDILTVIPLKSIQPENHQVPYKDKTLC